MAAVAPSPYPQAGEVIDGKYRIERVLGEGGMGCVAKATHLILRSPVALKFMNPQFTTFPGAVDRFINEGIASKRIRSTHVVPVDDVGKLPSGAPYLVMPCLEGVDLSDLLARDGTPGLPVTRSVHFVLQILRGLQSAHAAGIIHRDMKPSNCFVVKHEGEPDFVRILDFGISKVQQPGSASLTQTNSALGTPLYMSPEQARSPRDVDGRSDLYSVGVILYELLTGHTPFFSESGEFTEILFKLFTADPPPVKSTRPDLPDELAAAVHKALARETDNRFATAAEMAEAVAPFADERGKELLQRLRAFKPEQAVSMPPPADAGELPPSMVAFSRLDARPATDIMGQRPATELVRGSPATALMEGAPRRAAGSSPDARATPMDLSVRARPDEASDSTQMDFLQRGSSSMPAATAASLAPLPVQPAAPLPDLKATPSAVAITGARSDLEVSRNAAAAAADGGDPTRSGMPLVLGGFAILAVVGIGFTAAAVLKTKTSDPTRPDPPAASAGTEKTPSTLAPASATAAAPPASASSATQLAVASAVTSAAPPASAASGTTTAKAVAPGKTSATAPARTGTFATQTGGFDGK